MCRCNSSRTNFWETDSGSLPRERRKNDREDVKKPVSVDLRYDSLDGLCPFRGHHTGDYLTCRIVCCPSLLSYWCAIVRGTNDGQTAAKSASRRVGASESIVFLSMFRDVVVLLLCASILTRPEINFSKLASKPFYQHSILPKRPQPPCVCFCLIVFVLFFFTVCVRKRGAARCPRVDNGRYSLATGTTSCRRGYPWCSCWLLIRCAATRILFVDACALCPCDFENCCDDQSVRIHTCKGSRHSTLTLIHTRTHT